MSDAARAVVDAYAAWLNEAARLREAMAANDIEIPVPLKWLWEPRSTDTPGAAVSTATSEGCERSEGFAFTPEFYARQVEAAKAHGESWNLDEAETIAFLAAHGIDCRWGTGQIASLLTELLHRTRLDERERIAKQSTPSSCDDRPVGLSETWPVVLGDAIERAETKHPNGTDGLRSLTEEVGEVANAMRRETVERVRAELIDVAVVAIRFWNELGSQQPDDRFRIPAARTFDRNPPQDPEAEAQRSLNRIDRLRQASRKRSVDR